MYIIKVSLGSESRRVAVDKLMPFGTLQQLIKNMFAAELPSGNFVIKYKDDEDDLVALSSDLELQEAVRQIPANEPVKMLRLFLNETSPANVSISAASFTDLGISAPISIASEPAVAVPAVVAAPASVPEPSYPAIPEPADAQTESKPTAQKSEAPEPAPAVAPAALVRDINVLELIEKRLQEAFKAVSTLMNSLEIDTKMVEVLDGCHKAFTEVSSAAQSKIIVPLSEFTKAKKNDFGSELEKFQAEIKKLQQQLKEEVQKAIAALSSPSQPASSSTSAPVPEGRSPAQEPVPSVYPAVPAEEKLPEDAALDDLNKLAEMGFVDRVRNLELLAKHHGNVLAVVEELLSA
eukprot:TRINITY_DN730_c0_g2_i1.p1 TRINITY_DN730_c0_g2~~TRINITY_DN730_c0_g2_i1.p1  ORF type:complete len:382 (-),score=135.00 TRINITY_DN730_c0_g2_i1:393-1442(-)